MEVAVKYKQGGSMEAFNHIMASEMDRELKEGDFYIVTIKKASDNKLRTLLQNSAIHVYLRMIAQALNDAGLDMKKVLKPEVEISWNTDNAKEYLWKPIQKALYEKDSTTKLDTSEVSEVHKHLDRHLMTKFNIGFPFPSNR